MKFELTKSSYSNSQEEKEKYKKLGFAFEKPSPYLGIITYGNDRWVTSPRKVEVDINSLEELLKFVKEWGAYST